jgi:hypothetical protein
VSIIAGMTLDGVTFCFLLERVGRTDVFGRSDLCIHPDGPPPGTHGCIGINDGAAGLKKCSQPIRPHAQRATRGLGGVRVIPVGAPGSNLLDFKPARKLRPEHLCNFRGELILLVRFTDPR